MTRPEVAREFLRSEVEGLEPLEMILIAPMERPLEIAEVTRLEDASLEVRIPGRPMIVPQLSNENRVALNDLGFRSEDPLDPVKPWKVTAEDAEAAVELVQRVHVDVFGEKPDVHINIMHGSHRFEVEAERRLEESRVRIEEVLEGLFDKPAEKDEDEDYQIQIGQMRVSVAPRVMPDGQVVIRVFAITNVGVNVTGELGLFLARLNFGLMFGRFALDTENRSIWFDETLLGDDFREEELRFIVNTVAMTADGWDDRIKEMFGGVTHQEVLAGRARGKLPSTKPGQGVGMYL